MIGSVEKNRQLFLDKPSVSKALSLPLTTPIKAGILHPFRSRLAAKAVFGDDHGTTFHHPCHARLYRNALFGVFHFTYSPTQLLPCD